MKPTMKTGSVTIARPAPPVAKSAQLKRWRRLKLWVALARRNPHASRARRVVLLLGLLGLVNAFDLTFTVMAAQTSHFVELNPFADGLIKNTAALVAFKALLVLFAATVLLLFRRHRLTEIACWGLCALYAALAGRWWVYYFICH